eukprot:RCo039312
MAQNRKLQEEISRTLKRVSEGIIVFDETWDKVYNAPNQAQKEKFEAELKKEIKKLQRLREQIKAWLGSSEIKDKAPLQEARKDIENKMEAFKQCERETKTKAYSKEGLAHPEKQDPETMAKYKTRSWINNALHQLQIQIETFEADIEALGGRTKGRGKQQSKEVQLQQWIDKHQLHIRKLEVLLRLLENEELTPTEVDDLKEAVEEYVESNQDPDYYEAEDIYDGLISEAMLAGGDSDEEDSEQRSAGGSKVASPPPNPPSPSPT